MAEKYPFHGHDRGEIVWQEADGFHERPMTPAELIAREPALKITEDIYRHASRAGICYHEIWSLIAEAIQAGIDGRVTVGKSDSQ